MSNENKGRKGWVWGCVGCLSAVLVIVLIAGVALGAFLLRGKESGAMLDKGDDAVQAGDAAAEMRNLTQITKYPDVVVTDEASAAEALRRMQDAISFAGMDDFGAPVRSDAEQYTYFRFPQRLHSWEVSGHAVILTVDKNGRVCGVSGNYVPLSAADMQIKKDEQDAEKTLRKVYGKDAFVHVEDCCVLVQGGEPVYAWRALVEGENASKLCWVSVQNGKIIAERDLVRSFDVLGNGRDESGTPRVFITDENEDGVYTMKDNERNIVIYDAQGGDVSISLRNGNLGVMAPEGGDYYTFIIENDEIIFTQEEKDGITYNVHPMIINEDQGVAYLYERLDGKEYFLLDERDRVITDSPILTPIAHEESSGEDTLSVITDEDNVWHDYTAVSAKYAIEQIYDMYADVLGHEGYDGQGSALYLSIRDINGSGSIGCNYSMWLGEKPFSIIQLENGVDVDMNIVGHEYTHAVMNGIQGNVDSSRESSTIEEGLCDYFGELAEDYEDDRALNNSCDWVNIDRNLMSPGESPSMAKPSRYNSGESWYADAEADANDEVGVQVHHNSTVFSHAMYRMSMGVGTDEYIEPVGNAKLVQLVYDVMQRMTMTDGFKQTADLLREGAHRMCTDGYLTEKQARCVYIALENALLYPTYEVAPNAELVFNDITNVQLKECSLYISEADFDARPPSFTDKGKSIEVQDGTYCLSLEEGKSYRVLLMDKEDENMLYTAQLKVKSDGAAKQVVKTDIFPQYKVVGNGGNYVGYGPHTYYWKYNADSFAKTGLLGYFGQVEQTVNQLVRRDAQGNETVLLEDKGYGEIYIAKRRIYYNTGDGLKSCGLDGADLRSHAGEFTILGVEPETETLIYRDQRDRQATAENQIYVLSEDGSRITLSRDNFDHDGQQPALLALGGGNIYYLRNHDNRDGKHSLIVLGADMEGNTRHIGSITYVRDDIDGVDVSAQLVEDTLYVSYALVQGTGLFYNNGGVAAMNTAKEEAAEYIISQNSRYALCFAATHVSVDKNGARTLHFSSEHGAGARYSWLEDNVQAMDLLTGSVTRSDLPLVRSGEYAVKNGDIVTVRGTDEEATVVVSARVLAQHGYHEFVGASDAQGGYELRLVDVMGDYAFIEITKTQRDPSEDLGWRYGYKRVSTAVYVTEIGTDALELLYEY